MGAVLSKILSILFLLSFLLWCGCAAARSAPDGFSELAQKLSPSVVNIVAEKQRTADGQDSRSVGSGFVIDANGLIVTNNHVIDGASEIYVGFVDGSRRIARLEGRDQKSDIALLRVWPDRLLGALELGDSDEAKAGDWVLAIGNPFGLGGSVTAGIISARDRQLDTDAYDDFIQTDVAINRGSSGGPLFDLEGRVVGVNSSLMSPNGGSAGVSFAIPSNTVKAIVSQLRKYGRVRRGWIGANVQDLTPDLAMAFLQTTTIGALVAHVTPSGPAALAGLAPGDIVTRIDGRVVLDSRTMQRAIVDSDIGKALAVVVVRKSKPLQMTVRVARRADDAEVEVSAERQQPTASSDLSLGLTCEALANSSRARLGLGTALEGALVKNVAKGSSAAEADVKVGDVVLEVGQKRVKSPQEIKNQFAVARTENRSVVLVSLIRGGEMMFKALRLSNRKLDTALNSPKR